MTNSQVEWPVLPEGYEAISVSPLYVSFDGETFYEKPDDMTLGEFLDQFKSDQSTRDRRTGSPVP